METEFKRQADANKEATSSLTGSSDAGSFNGANRTEALDGKTDAELTNKENAEVSDTYHYNK